MMNNLFVLWVLRRMLGLLQIRTSDMTCTVYHHDHPRHHRDHRNHSPDHQPSQPSNEPLKEWKNQ